MNKTPQYNVVVSDRAKDMLFEHARFLAQVSINAAEELFNEFEEKVSSLEEMPERYAVYINPYIKTGKYRRFSLGNYLLGLFQVVGREVFIDLIIDVRAENKNLPNT